MSTRLRGGWLGPKAWENHVPCPSLADLKRAQAAVDKRLIAVCNTLTPDLLDSVVRVHRDTRVQTERRDRLLMPSTRSIIVGRHTPWSPQQPSDHLNSTSFFRSLKHLFGPSSSTVLVGPKKLCGGHNPFLHHCGAMYRRRATDRHRRRISPSGQSRRSDPETTTSDLPR